MGRTNLRSRLQLIERRMGAPRTGVLVVVWDGRDEDVWRMKVEEARRNGTRISMVRMGLYRDAENAEDAEALVAEHKASQRETPITVYRSGSDETILAEWVPELPVWLREAIDSRESGR